MNIYHVRVTLNVAAAADDPEDLAHRIKLAEENFDLVAGVGIYERSLEIVECHEADLVAELYREGE